MFQDRSQEDGHAKGVGGMGGDEAILSARHALGKMDEVLKIGIKTRSQPLKNGLADMRGQLVGAKHHKGDGHDDPPTTLAVLPYGPIY